MSVYLRWNKICMSHFWSKISALNTTLKLSAVALTLDIKYNYHYLYYNLEGENKYSKITAKIKCHLQYRNHQLFLQLHYLGFLKC